MQEKMTRIATIDENCISIQGQTAQVKIDTQQFVDSFIAVIEAQKNHVFDEVENKVRKSLQLLEKQKHVIKENMKMQETEIRKTEMILKRSKHSQIMQPHEFLDNEIFQEKG